MDRLLKVAQKSFRRLALVALLLGGLAVPVGEAKADDTAIVPWVCGVSQRAGGFCPQTVSCGWFFNCPLVSNVGTLCFCG